MNLSVKVVRIGEDEIFKTHPIFPDFLDKFNKRVEKGQLSSNIYFTWVFYWFTNQNKYDSVSFKIYEESEESEDSEDSEDSEEDEESEDSEEDEESEEGEKNKIEENDILRSITLKKEGNSIVVTGKEVSFYEPKKVNTSEYRIDNISSYEKIKEKKLIGTYVFSFNYNNSFLNGGKEFKNCLVRKAFSSILVCDHELEHRVVYIGEKEKYFYDDSNICSSVGINVYICLFEEHLSTEVVNLLFYTLCNKEESSLLNRWHENDIAMIYFTDIEDVNIGTRWTITVKLKGYWCFKWVYDLVIRPHLLAYEALKDGRWSETQFRDYILNNFNIEAETIEELREKAEKLLYTPSWIDSFNIESLRELI